MARKARRAPLRPVNLWDVRLDLDADVSLDLPEGHTAMIAVLSGHVTVNGSQRAGEAEIVRFERDGSTVRLHADAQFVLLVMTGEPLGDPVFGYGPFVMTNETEIRQAIDDFNSGRLGRMEVADPRASGPEPDQLIEAAQNQHGRAPPIDEPVARRLARPPGREQQPPRQRRTGAKCRSRCCGGT